MYDTLSGKILKKLNTVEDKKELTAQETEKIVEWKESMKMKDDIILEAVTRAVRNKVTNFNYINKILSKWAEQGVESYSDILEIDKNYKHKDKKKGFEVKIKKLTDTAKTPTYGSSSAAGADLYADIEEDIYIPKGQTTMIHTGLSMEIPDGYVGLIFARSGLSCKHGLAPANKVGVIDSDYRGEIMVALHNHEDYIDTSDSDYEDYKNRHTIRSGDRIAQIAFMPVKQADFTEISQLDSTDRGEGGFGSTGKN